MTFALRSTKLMAFFVISTLACANSFAAAIPGPSYPGNPGGGSCTANPAACKVSDNGEKGHYALVYALMAGRSPATAGINCPANSCNPANGCIDGCAR